MKAFFSFFFGCGKNTIQGNDIHRVDDVSLRYFKGTETVGKLATFYQEIKIIRRRAAYNFSKQKTNGDNAWEYVHVSLGNTTKISKCKGRFL